MTDELGGSHLKNRLRSIRDYLQATPNRFLHYRFLYYSVALLSVTLALGITLLLQPLLGTIYTPLFFAAVILSAWYGGLKPGLLATLLSTIAINYFFIEPLYSLKISSLGSITQLSVFVMAAGLIGYLNTSLHLAKQRADANLRSLRESEARFGRLVEAGILGVIVADMNGSVIEANQTFLQMVGYSQEDLRSGRIRWREMTPPEFDEVSQRSIEELRTTGVCTPFEKEYIRKDGSRIPVLLGSALVGEQTVIGFVLDLSERKRAEAEALQRTYLAEEAQTLLHLLLEHVPEGIMIAGKPPHFPIIANSRLAQELLGVPNDMILGVSSGYHIQSCNIFLADGVTVPAPEQMPLYRATRYGEMVTDEELVIQRPDGTHITILANAVPIRDAQNQIIGAINCWRDITERKQAELDLQAANIRFQWATAAVNCLVYDWDIVEDRVERSEGLTRILGYSLAEAEPTGKWWRDRIHPDDLQRAKAEAEVLLAKGDRYAVEYRVLNQNNQYVYVLDQAIVLQRDAKGNPLRQIGSTTDITDRKQAEQALRQSEHRFRRLVESNIFGVAFGNFEGTIHYVNDYFLKMTGYTREEILAGQIRWIDITPPEYLPLDAQAAAELRQYGVSTPFRKEYVHKDGHRVPVLIGSALLQEPYDQQQEIIGFYLDLTKQKQAEQEREQLLQREQAARAEAEAANRVKDEFLAVLSHELRSPLNPIVGWSKLLRTRKLDDATSQRALETIERNAQIQAQLIEDLLDVSRILRGKLSLHIVPIDLATTIEAAIETVRLAAEAKAITLTTDFAPQLGPVAGDAGRLQQVVWNLLSNAVKFTPQGGHISVRLEQLELEQNQLEQTGRSSLSPSPCCCAQITVSDTGKGIPADFLPHVFDYFRQADATTTRTFGGLGLGLAIVRHLVELHGGEVQAESAGEGQGASFRVRLPLSSSSVKADTSGRSVSSASLEGVKVLVVDDDEHTREFVVFLLQLHGAVVRGVGSGQEGLAVLREMRPDVLMSDIGMPEMDGYMLMERVRGLGAAEGGETPAIALTAYAGEIDYRQAMAAGFNKHLAKPVEPDQLIAAVANLIENKSENHH